MPPNLFDQAVAFHDALPSRIRAYLNSRGIPDALIDGYLLGWTGDRISIPIRDRGGDIASFKFRKDPDDQSDSPKMYAMPGARAELYGWERVLEKSGEIVICEGEFDRLVLEANGFPAATSTAGAGGFLAEWAADFADIPHVYLCFDNDSAGRNGTARIAALIPHARAVTWPAEIGEGGDVTDFFVRLGKSANDFRALLESAQALSIPSQTKKGKRGVRDGNVEQVKASVAIEDIIARYLDLTVRGRNYVAHCPFHADRTPSFVVFRRTRTFHCFGCSAHGDALTFLMKVENLTFTEALAVLREL